MMIVWLVLVEIVNTHSQRDCETRFVRNSRIFLNRPVIAAYRESAIYEYSWYKIANG